MNKFIIKDVNKFNLLSDCELLTYGNIFPKPLEEGIFDYIDLSTLNIPNFNKTSVNNLYFQRSCCKKLSNLVYTYFEDNLEFDEYITLNNAMKRILGEIIKTKYYYNWKKLVDSYIKDYDMLKPYSMTVDETSNDSLVSHNSNENSSSSNEISKNDYQGFNSAEYNPVDKNDLETSDNSNSRTDYDRTIDVTRNTERVGNIGNRSSQELIKEEREVRIWNIYDQIFSDIDNILTTKIYI